MARLQFIFRHGRINAESPQWENVEIALMCWSEQFDEPIELTKGTALCSLRDAANYFIDLPPSKSLDEHWQLAMRFLVRAAEGKGSVWLARIAVVRALDHEKRNSTVGKLTNRQPNVGLQIGL